MKLKLKFSWLLPLLLAGQIVFAQTNKEKAYELGEDAIRLMDEGKTKESIQLLEEAIKLDPDNFAYPYEMAYALYLNKDYKAVIKSLEKLKSHKDVSAHLFQLLGNSYDIVGDREKALEVYDAGLKMFPKSGRLYLEKGNVFWYNKDYNKALSFYEKGIEIDPKFPSNYYRATLMYLDSKEKIWGMIYGEIFMNLERNSKRTTEISKLLYDTYKTQIKIKNDTAMTVSFCQQMNMDISAFSDPQKVRLPFCMIYESTLILSIIGEKNINIKTLNTIRANFIDNYFRKDKEKLYPNILFSFQEKIKDAGHFEAYNYWILMKGDEVAFNEWRAANKSKWEHFIKWFLENKFLINENYKFLRSQY